MSHGYRIISQSGSGVGTSGKARYSADVAVTDYRWVWTLVRDDMAPPPYPTALNSHSTQVASLSGMSSYPAVQQIEGSINHKASCSFERKYPSFDEENNGKK